MLRPGLGKRSIHVTAVVICDAGEVLLVRKRGTRPWIFPGGKPEPGETAAAAGVREVAEELGVAVPPSALKGLGRYEVAAANEAGFRLVAEVFEIAGGLATMTVGREDLAATREIAEARWHAVAQVDAPDLAPLTRVVLAALAPQARQNDPMTESDLPQISRDDLADDAVMLDVRDAAAYAEGHAPGAVNIPIADLPGRLADLPAFAGTLPVTCGGGTKGKRATALLRENGIEAAELRGGMRGWAGAGRPTRQG